MTTYRAVVTIASPDIGGTGVNIFHLSDGGTDPGDTAWNDAIDALGDFYNGVTSKVPSSTTFAFDGELIEVEGGSSSSVTGLHTFSIIGGTTVQGLPVANTICVGWRTGVHTRSGMGRTFLGPIAQDTNGADGKPTQAVVDDVKDAADGLIAAVDAISGVDFVVWSPTLHASRVITSSVIHRKYAILRSRRD